MADKIWVRCDACMGTGKVMNGFPSEEVDCKQCEGSGVKLIGYIAKNIKDAQEALIDKV